MAESGLSVTYSDLIGKVGRYLGFGPTPSSYSADQTDQCNECVEHGYRNFIHPPGQPAQSWSFLKPIYAMNLAIGVTDYDLPEEYAGIEGEITIVTTTNIYWAVKQVTPEIILTKRMHGLTSSGRLELVAKTAKLLQPGAPQRFSLMFWPSPDDSYQVQFKMCVQPGPLSADNPYPYGGAAHTQTLIESCLAEAELQLDDEPGAHAQAFAAALTASIQADSQQGRSEHMGYIGDPSTPEGFSPGRPYYLQNANATYMGQTW